MFLKLIGIILIIVGGSIVLGALFPLIGSLFKLAWVLGQLLVAALMILFGYRFLTRESDGF